MDRSLLCRAWIFLGLIDATLVLAGFFFVSFPPAATPALQYDVDEPVCPTSAE